MFKTILFWISVILSFVFGTVGGKFETLTEEEHISIIRENIDDFNALAEASIKESSANSIKKTGGPPKKDSLDAAWLRIVSKKYGINNKIIKRNILDRIDLKYPDDNVIVVFYFNMDAKDTFDSNFYYSQNDTPYDPWQFKEPELTYDEENKYYIKNTDIHPYITYRITDNWFFSKRTNK